MKNSFLAFSPPCLAMVSIAKSLIIGPDAQEAAPTDKAA